MLSFIQCSRIILVTLLAFALTLCCSCLHSPQLLHVSWTQLEKDVWQLDLEVSDIAQPEEYSRIALAQLDQLGPPTARAAPYEVRTLLYSESQFLATVLFRSEIAGTWTHEQTYVHSAGLTE